MVRVYFAYTFFSFFVLVIRSDDTQAVGVSLWFSARLDCVAKIHLWKSFAVSELIFVFLSIATGKKWSWFVLFFCCFVLVYVQL